jgi:hypothetical protein
MNDDNLYADGNGGNSTPWSQNTPVNTGDTLVVESETVENEMSEENGEENEDDAELLGAEWTAFFDDEEQLDGEDDEEGEEDDECKETKE